MKKLICTVLALLLVLTGCKGAGTSATSPTDAQPQELSAPTQAASGLLPETVPASLKEGELPFENAGKARLAYQGNRSYVRYVTKVEDLPPECSWEGYDEAYFETKALLIVVETVSSGSVQLELESIRISDGTASVSIKRTMSGDVGTADMATWLIWAEVEKGLECTWTLENASQLPEGEKY